MVPITGYGDFHAGLHSGWNYLSPINVYLTGTLFNILCTSVLEAIGRPSNKIARTVDVLGGKPARENYARSVDDWRFGWRDFNVPPFPLRRPNQRFEQEVLHPSYSGFGADGEIVQGPFYSAYADEDSLWGLDMPKRFNTSAAIFSLNFSPTLAPSFGGQTPNTGRKHLATDLQKAFEDHTDWPIWIHDNSPAAPHAVRLERVTFYSGDEFVDATFEGELRLSPFATNVTTSSVWWGIPFYERMRIATRTPQQVDEPISSNEMLVSRAKYRRWLSLGGAYAHGLSGDIPGSMTSISGLSHTWEGDSPQCIFASITTNGVLSRFRPLEADHLVINDPGYGLPHFTGAIQNEMKSLLPASFFSSADAISQHVDVIQANYIESLSELGSIASLLPDLGNVIKFFTAAKRGEWLNAGRTLLETWSEFQLQWDFGIKPAISDITELSNKYDDVVNRLKEDNLWGKKVLRGKFDFDFPSGTFGVDGISHMTVRSKVVTSFGRSSIFAAMLKGKAAGLLPSFSSLWDLVPFSFVVDWYANVGEKLEDAEDQLLMLCLPCHYCVHSFTITHAFSTAELLDRKLSITKLGDPPGMTFYYRMPSKIFPVLRDSKYDFRGASGPRNLAVAGALVVALVT
jgi:hypothetical protein